MFSWIRLRRASRNVSSLIGANLTVSGSLVSDGTIQVNGRVDGDIRANALVVGDQAQVCGDIYAEDAVIRGRVEGGIRARKVQLCATARVQGNILHEALAMEAGAFFEGNSRHSDDPLGDALHVPPQKTPKAVATASAVIAPNLAGDPVGGAQARLAASFTPLKA